MAHEAWLSRIAPVLVFASTLLQARVLAPRSLVRGVLQSSFGQLGQCVSTPPPSCCLARRVMLQQQSFFVGEGGRTWSG